MIKREHRHREERQQVSRATGLNLRHHSFLLLELASIERLQAPAGIWATRKVQPGKVSHCYDSCSLAR
jgi:hypothetical protein